ncbi:vacuolar sorting-associated 41 -like protein, partial [Brachionus plicatilis]
HELTVNDLTIDTKEEYVASCSDDGKVAVFGLFESEHDQIIEFNRPIKSIELAPNFNQTLSFVTGDTKLVLVERGFMGRRKTSVLHQGEGIIRNIKWCNDLIAWSNEKGVKIYSLAESKIMSFIAKDHESSLRDELYRCSLLWQDKDSLIIGWADRFKICKIIRSRSSGLISHIEITSLVKTDFYIVGLAPFKDQNQFLLLCYEKSEDSRPHIRVAQASPDSFIEISFDAITIKEYEKNRPFEYRLDYILNEGSYFVLSPKDLIKATPRSFDDHIKWLMERLNFEQALEDIKNAPESPKVFTYQVVGLNYIDYLISAKEYKEAAEWCSKVTLSEKNWEEKILIFAKECKLEDIFEKIPSSNPVLSPEIYEKVLNEFLRSGDYEIFKYLIRKWPCDIYGLDCVTQAIATACNKSKNKILDECLALMYEYQKMFDKAFEIYLNLQDQAVFDFLLKHELFECAYKNLIELISLNKQRSIQILVDNVEKLPVKRVAEKLNKNKLYLHYYLDAIFEKDPNISRDFHTIQVVLYAEFQRDKLLKFLQSSQYISLTQAQKELQERDLGPEIVYILERTGQIKKGLQIVLHAIKDVNQAIEFCKRHNDKDLWEDLIQYSVNKPDYIIGLLNNIGTHVDPVDLINRIPNGVTIRGLRDALVKILSDYRVQISLLEGSKSIMTRDCFNLLEKQIKVVKQGVSVDDDQKCPACDELLITFNVNMARGLKIFECRHSFHEDCIQENDKCSVCSQNKSSVLSLFNAD